MINLQNPVFSVNSTVGGSGTVDYDQMSIVSATLVNDGSKQYIVYNIKFTSSATPSAPAVQAKGQINRDGNSISEIIVPPDFPLNKTLTGPQLSTAIGWITDLIGNMESGLIGIGQVEGSIA